MNAHPTLISRDLLRYMAEALPGIERALRLHLPAARAREIGYFNEALNYALFPGGKRIRPILTLLGSEVVGGKRGDVLSAAAAVEYIHNSSLIFDDLPCMDDASARRGRIPLHKLYGEGVSILVALNLMNAAYGIMLKSSPNVERAFQAHAELLECIGPNGMLGGQSFDLLASGSKVNGDEENNFEKFRNRKTSSLIQLSLTVGAILVGASQGQLDALSRFAEAIGNAYQVVDDLRDQNEDALRSGNGNHASHLLVSPAESSGRVVSSLIDEAKHAIEIEFGRSEHSRLLCEIADFVRHRIPEAQLQSSD